MYRQRAREVFYNSFLENASVSNILAVPRDGIYPFRVLQLGGQCVRYPHKGATATSSSTSLYNLGPKQLDSECEHSDWSEMWKSARVSLRTSSFCLYIALFLCIFLSFLVVCFGLLESSSQVWQLGSVSVSCFPLNCPDLNGYIAFPTYVYCTLASSFLAWFLIVISAIMILLRSSFLGSSSKTVCTSRLFMLFPPTAALICHVFQMSIRRA